MIIYDSHADVFSNLYERHLKKVKDPFKKYHLSNLKKGCVKGGIFVVYSESFFDVEQALSIALDEFKKYKDSFDVVIGLEGLKNVPDLECFKRLYDMGVRHAMLTWNEENHLATGVAGEADHGLKPLGKEFLDFMKEHKMIIDVSHLNEKSFYDVMDYVKCPVIASHSCAYSLSDHRRNLKDDQLKLLKETSSYVGVNSARNFVSKNKDLQNIHGLCLQIDYLVKHLDIDHVMLGLDMMDYLDDVYTNANLDDLQTHADCQKIVTELENMGYSTEDIEKITHLNYLKMIKELTK